VARDAVTIKLTKEFDRLPKLPAEVRRRLSLVVRKTAKDVEARAKVRAPVDTGALKGSIQARPVDELTSEVVVGQEYGIYQEFGTVRMPARPYLRPAVEEVAPAFEQAIAQAIEEAARSG
jgi:HK97 gp10 family phage protein